MTQIPAGWYPDPDPQAPEPKGQRYWDGQQWTEHVYPAPGQAAQDPYGQQQGPYGQQQGYGAQQGQYGQAPYGQGEYPADQFGRTPFTPGAPQAPSRAYAPMAPYAGAGQTRATTPDGQELAGWWVRVAAFLIDNIIVGIIAAIVAFPWMAQIFDAYGDFLSEALDAAEAGSTTVPGQAELMAEITGPLVTVSLIGLVVSLVYQSLFLRWKAATPGKLLVGLRVRLRERPGQLSWATILKRWVSQFGYALFSAVPVLGSLLSLYPLLDGLWPLWDSKKQALHDKVAATNVVRQRGDTWTPGQEQQGHQTQQGYQDQQGY